MKLQDLKLLIKNTLKQKGTIHSKLYLYKIKKKKYPTSYHAKQHNLMLSHMISKCQAFSNFTCDFFQMTKNLKTYLNHSCKKCRNKVDTLKFKV